MAITDVVTIENYMLTDIEPGFEYQVEEWIAGVEEEMNKMTNRKLIGDDEAEFYYDGTGTHELVIDDFTTITEVLDGTNDITADIFKYPLNSSPKWKLKVKNRVFLKDYSNIKVTGIQGAYTTATLPKALKKAATVLVAGIINAYYDASGGNIKSESIGRYQVTYATDEGNRDFEDAKATIKLYRRTA